MSLDPLIYQIALPALAALFGGSSLLLAKRAGKHLDAMNNPAAEPVRPSPVVAKVAPVRKADFIAIGGSERSPFKHVVVAAGEGTSATFAKSKQVYVVEKHIAPKTARGRYRTVGRFSKTGKFTAAKAD